MNGLIHERKLGIFLLCCLAASLWLTPWTIGAPEQVEHDSSALARELWEQALEAKGGRERLHAVSSIHKSLRSLRKALTKRTHHELYVFPNKYWGWHDERGSRYFGLSMTMYNQDRKLYFGAREGKEIYRSRDPIVPGRQRLQEVQLVHLMESRWLKPTPVRVWTEGRGSRKVDVVETRVDDMQVEYYLDRESHLPVRVRYEMRIRKGGKEEWLYEFRIKEYMEVDGIKLGRRVDAKHIFPGWFVKKEYDWELNVDYDPCIFEGPPRIEDGPDGWRRGKAGCTSSEQSQ